MLLALPHLEFLALASPRRRGSPRACVRLRRVARLARGGGASGATASLGLLFVDWAGLGPAASSSCVVVGFVFLIGACEGRKLARVRAD